MKRGGGDKWAIFVVLYQDNAMHLLYGRNLSGSHRGQLRQCDGDEGAAGFVGAGMLI
jgi:hypothetical protein